MNKKYIILISIIIVYFLFFFFFIGLGEIKNNKREATIFLDENTVWTLEKNSWSNITDEIDKKEFNGLEFNVFSNYENIGKYYLWRDEKWYLFDKNRKPYLYDEGNFLAVRANYNINVLKFEPQEINDQRYINTVLSENNITDSEEFTVSNLYQIDFDSDGVKENFYAISNAFARETSPDKVFSIVFMEKVGQIYYLYNSISSNDGQNSCKPYINTVVDLNEDDVYEIILSCGYFSIQSRHDMLYQFKDNNFDLILSNQ